MFYAMYTNDIIEAATVKCVDSNDGEFAVLQKQQLLDAKASNPALLDQFANVKVLDNEIKFTALDLPLDIAFLGFKTERVDDKLIISRNGESAEVAWSDTKQLVGLFINDSKTEIDLYVYDKSDAAGQKIQVPLAA